MPAHHRRRRGSRVTTPKEPNLLDLDGYNAASFVMLSIAHPNNITEAMAATHDLVIEAMGTTRRTGIRWLHLNGDRAEHFLATYLEEFPDALVAVSTCRAQLEAHNDAILLITYAGGTGTQ